MKTGFLFLAIFSSLVLSACGGAKGRMADNSKAKSKDVLTQETSDEKNELQEQAEAVLELGSGILVTTGALSENLSLNVKNGDEIICAKTEMGFHVMIAPKKYNSTEKAEEVPPSGVHILGTPDAKIPGEFDLSKEDSQMLISYDLAGDASQEWRAVEGKACVVKVKETEVAENLKVSVDCILQQEKTKDTNSTLQLKAEIKCSTADEKTETDKDKTETEELKILSAETSKQ